MVGGNVSDDVVNEIGRAFRTGLVLVGSTRSVLPERRRRLFSLLLGESSSPP